MGRTVIAEEKLFPELVRLGKTDGLIPGLILGQCSGQQDFIIHLAKTPLPAEKSSKSGNDLSGDSRKIPKKSLEKLGELQDSWLTDHAQQVTRMLPGGVWVLGMFVTGPGDIFADSASQAKLGSLLKALNKSLETNESLYGISPSSEKLALQLVSGTNKFVCKSYDVSASSVVFRSADCKFSSGLKWHQLDCQYDFDSLPSYLITEKTSNRPLKDHLQDILEAVCSGVKKSQCTIDGEIRNNDDFLDASETTTSKQNKNEKKTQESKNFQINLYIPSAWDSQADMYLGSLVGEMRCTGVLASRVFLHQKATVAEAIRAVKEDIIRSFAARIEMHCDSLVEEEVASPDEVMVVHEPPRRVLIPLPHSRVALSDYLFPGEGPSEALVSIFDLIGVTVSEAAVCKDFEGQPDQSDLYNLTTGADTPKTEETSISSSTHSMLAFSGIGIAFLILLMSLFVHFYLK